MKRWLHVIGPALVLAFAITLRTVEPSFIQQGRLLVFDTYQRLKPRAYVALPVRIVDIDDDSLRRLGQWPWPRILIARLIDKLTEMGAAAIALDIVFAEPDRTSPQRVLRLWPDSPALEYLRSLANRLPDHDRVLADAIARANVVTAFSLTVEANGRRPARKAGFAETGDDPRPFLPAFRGAVTSLPALVAAAAGNGSLNNLPDLDGVSRRVPLLMRIGNDIYPSLAAEVLRIAQGATTYVLKSSGASGEGGFGERTGLTDVKIGAFAAPTDSAGRMWLHDTGSVPARYVPAWRVLAGQADPAEIAGAIMLVGTSAAGLKDLRTTPLERAVAGVELHAQIVEQILSGTALERPDWSLGAEVFYTLLLGVLLIVLLPRWGPIWCAVLGGGAIALAVGASWYAFDRESLLLDPLYPTITGFLIYLVESSIIYLRTEAERRHIRKAFSHYLAPAIVDRLARQGRMPTQGGEIREVTVWISDLENYSTYSELLSPTELVSLLNRVYTVMGDTVEEHGGFVAQFVGDAMVAAFNVPLDDPDHARHAVEAALVCQTRVAELSTRITLPTGLRLHNRIGVSTGQLLVGNIGSQRRLSYSIVGDDINLSSRLEGVNKIYRSSILVNEVTKDLCGPAIRFREVDVVRVKGRDTPVRIFEPLGLDGEIAPAREAALADFARALEVFRARRFAAAAELFERLATDDPVAGAYLDRARAFAAAPPADDWDGINTLTEK